MGNKADLKLILGNSPAEHASWCAQLGLQVAVEKRATLKKRLWKSGRSYSGVTFFMFCSDSTISGFAVMSFDANINLPTVTRRRRYCAWHIQVYSFSTEGPMVALVESNGDERRSDAFGAFSDRIGAALANLGFTVVDTSPENSR